jgi:hypothetical protein
LKIIHPDRQDHACLWRECLQQRGQAGLYHVGRYRDRVAGVLEKWFDEHRNVLQKVEKELQNAWNVTVLEWAHEIRGN